jgi:hypothetical protein
MRPVAFERSPVARHSRSVCGQLPRTQSHVSDLISPAARTVPHQRRLVTRAIRPLCSCAGGGPLTAARTRIGTHAHTAHSSHRRTRTLSTGPPIAARTYSHVLGLSLSLTLSLSLSLSLSLTHTHTHTIPRWSTGPASEALWPLTQCAGKARNRARMPPLWPCGRSRRTHILVWPREDGDRRRRRRRRREAHETTDAGNERAAHLVSFQGPGGLSRAAVHRPGRPEPLQPQQRVSRAETVHSLCDAAPRRWRSKHAQQRSCTLIIAQSCAQSLNATPRRSGGSVVQPLQRHRGDVSYGGCGTPWDMEHVH